MHISLRLKTYLLGSFAFLATVVGIFVVSQTIFTPGLEKIEQTEIRNEMLRAQIAVSQQLAELGESASAYSSSSEAVESVTAMEAGHELPAGLWDSVFPALRADMAALVRPDGSVAWGKAVDPEAEKPVSLPVALTNLVAPGAPLVAHQNADSRVSGVVMLGGKPMLIDSQPVLDGGPDGTVLGALVVGRWLDASLLEDLGAQTLLTLDTVRVSQTDLLAKAETPASLLLAQSPISVASKDAQTMAGYLALEDIYGEPAVLLEVTMPALVSQRMTNTWGHFILGLLAVGAVFGAGAIILLEGSLFRRIGRLTKEVRRARLNGGRIAPIAIDGKDELALFAKAINEAFHQITWMRTEQEKQAGSLVNTLEELQVRHRDLEKAHRHLQQLQLASASLSGTLEIREALAELEQIALDIFQADEVWLLRLEEGQRLEGLRAFARRSSDVDLPGVFGCESEDASLPAKVNRLLSTVIDGDAIFIDAVHDMEPDELQRLFGGPLPDMGELRSLAVVPLLAEQCPVGLVVSASARPAQFTEDRRSTILLFASQVAQAIKNARLYEEIKALGEIDSLTGLFNRRKALEQLEAEISRASRYLGTFSILMGDIDNFKLFNDTYGHPAGDVIIKRVAGVLRHGTRSSDFVARYGGDEFMLILPETYRLTAGSTADHLRAALGSLPYAAPNGASIPLRMSFGAASFPEDGMDAASLIATADANLYESKRWGGDTVTIEREEFCSEAATGSKGFSTLDALVSAVDNKDHYTRRHSAQVAEHALAIARAIGLDETGQGTLQVAALLHDVGKIALPDRILRKPGSLTDEEAEAVKHHSLMGGMMISQHLPGLEDVRDAVSSHHERWDGAGYPNGLRSQDIPLLGRILAVADVYSAMTTDRPYRAALPVEQAIAELEKGAGTQLDARLVTAFISCLSLGFKASPTRGRVSSDGRLDRHPLRRASDRTSW